jgi:ABC-type phosphate transport system permease subunit
VAEQHGAYTAIYGTLVSALLALLIARSSPSASAWCSA